MEQIFVKILIKYLIYDINITVIKKHRKEIQLSK